MRGWRSLERRLPLLITGLLAVMLASALALTYATLRQAASDRAQRRLERMADQLATLAESSAVRLERTVDAVAADASVRRALAGAPDAADDARAALRALLAPADSGLTVELWSEDGRRVAFAGADLRAGGAATLRPGDEGHAGLPPALGADGADGLDSARLGSLYVAADTVYFWVAAPVRDERGARRGYVARQYRITGGARTDETIRALTGADVRTYYRDLATELWTTLGGVPATPPAGRDSTADEVVVERPEAGRLYSVERPVAGTSLAVVLELPVGSALAASRATVVRLSLVSLLLLLVGAAVAWLLSRRITRRLASLTAAAEAIAAGDYAVRVPPSGDDELTLLAASFNRMAGEVGSSRGDLESQTEEARAAADELEQSNARLGAALSSLEEREAQFRALADAIPQLSWMAEADGSIFWYNERWYEYTGTTPEEMRGWGWQSVHDPALLPQVVERWRASIATGSSFEMEFPLRGADGRFRWFLTRVEPVRDREGRVVRWFGTNTDVQALREARDAAEAARADAERAREEAEAASRAKSEFLAVMSHELRTPLNAIGGYTELMALGIRGPVTEVQRRDLDRIRAAQQHLLGLIGAVLDLSRIEAGRIAYDVAPILVEPFLAGLDALVAPQAAAKSLVLEHRPTEPQLAVLADREKLRQILLNLLSNAIRHTPPGGRITLAAAARDDRTVAITTTDTGVGIAASELERIFEPFVQLDRSLTQVREGVGLGLSISRDLARGMRGEITAESRPGEGARFTLTLPRATVSDGVALGAATGEYPAMGRGV